MILKGDAKTLEWRSYLEWANDTVGIQEIIDGRDIHTENKNYFKLPTRLISKTFLFRWIYRGSAYAYANDADFIPTSSSTKFWQRAIDAANEKYRILYEFQNLLIEQATHGSVVTIPSGREYKFEMKEGKSGEWYYNIRDIVNYPNQGYAADLMVIARISLRNRLRKLEEYKQKQILIFNTVHDDIQLDCINYGPTIEKIGHIMEDVFRDIPNNFNKLYKYEFKIPLAGEVSVGNNLHNLIDLKKYVDNGYKLVYTSSNG